MVLWSILIAQAFRGQHLLIFLAYIWVNLRHSIGLDVFAEIGVDIFTHVSGERLLSEKFTC